MVRFFLYFFAVMALLTLPLKSYGQDNKTVYSCDPEINEWVKGNLDKIHKMSRTEWLLLDEMKGRAVFAAFTPQQQQDFWQTKIKEVLALDWKTEERTHIQKLGNFFKEHFFIFSNHSPESEKFLDYQKLKRIHIVWLWTETITHTFLNPKTHEDMLELILVQTVIDT